MSVISLVGGAVTSLFGMGTEWVKASQQRKTAKLQHQLELEDAKTKSQVKKIQNAQEADIAWEQTSLNQAGWKDEFLLLLYSVPLVLCFIPEYAEYVERGFAILDQTPEWYQYSLGLMVASSYGHKKFLKHMNIKKGS